MSDFAYELKNGKIGRFPVWVVGLAVAGVIVVFLWWRSRSISRVTQTTPVIDDSLGQYNSMVGSNVDGLYDDYESYLYGDPTNPAFPVGGSASGIPGPVTNMQWARLAFDFLVGLGLDPAVVERALAKYVQGLSLTVSEQAIVNQALRAFGAPPEGLILHDTDPVPNQPAPNQPGPVQNPGTNAPNTGASGVQPRRGVNVARWTRTNTPWNSTIGGIANRFGRSVQNIIDWNNLAGRPRVGGAPVIFTGEWIWADPPA